MPKIQFEIPLELDKELKIFMINNNIKDKREAIKIILYDKFKITVKQGIKNLMGV